MNAVAPAPEPTIARPGRHPLAVVAWTFGLYVLVHLTQYAYIWLTVVSVGSTFGEVASGQVKTPWSLGLRGGVALALGLPVLWLAVRYLWRRDAAWMWSRPNPRAALGGTGLGLVLTAIVATFAAAAGVAQVSWPVPRPGLAETVMAHAGIVAWVVFVAVSEEYVFRGMATREFAARWGWPAATVVGGLYFGGVHLMAILPILTPALTAAVLLAALSVHGLFVALYVRGRSLWWPIGCHAGWNYMWSGLLGTTMSGRPRAGALWQMDLAGSPWLTGGPFGIETSVTAILVTALAAVAIGAWPRARTGDPR